ncbi:GMC oxidoreductase [Saccharophagus degradans]|uniref:2-keto-gluconate dehydrogenase subunit-like protein n=1 Tax=Saccharophagus degradans (strain 2-40 / ATCC 43961 / DSM 17024) TaxID=203122 RepID=Q21PG1_SACD2|nr:GMC family oxidoreductase [Saccharophagus degradans]ABD79418.1 2-keto-gluconate dehydrogenase subunit-like protein [Saccharophagus degradans 2-40]
MKYDLVIVGTGFASSFFLKRYLERFPAKRILVLELGSKLTHRWRVENRPEDDYSGVVSDKDYRKLINNHTPEKPWVYTPGFGGGSNCWWAVSPRLLPNDFKIKTLYGVGQDWPISYEELEPYYCDAEDIMQIAGPSEHTPFPRSRSYPQPPHNFTSVDKLIKQHYPNEFYNAPCARPSLGTPNRPKCCATGVCNLCPIDSKFTVLNELSHIYQHPSVTLQTNSQVISLDHSNGVVSKAIYLDEQDKRHEVEADLFMLGANPLFNSHILLGSNIDNANIGKGLAEHVGLGVEVNLINQSNLDGGTALTGHGYFLYDGEHRKDRAACIVETFNTPHIRLERGKYTHRLGMKFVFEELYAPESTVSLSSNIRIPDVHYAGHTQYLHNGVDHIKNNFEQYFGFLPIEDYEFSEILPAEGHILGTHLMGNDPSDSVVNKHGFVHGMKNLLVLGAGSFSAMSPANPSLTVSAVALKSASEL